MKSSILTSTAVAGLAPYRWNAFSMAAGANFAPLAASWTPTNFQCLADQGAGSFPSGSYPNFKYRFSGAGKIPAWIQPGVGLLISASVTDLTIQAGYSPQPNDVYYGGSPRYEAGDPVIQPIGPNNTSFNISGAYVVKDIAPDGSYFEVIAPRPNGSSDTVAFTQGVTGTIDNGSEAVPTPSVNLVIQCQKAMFSAASGNAIIAPVVDANGNAPYSVTIAAGGPEYEITAPPGCKFDLADWQVKQSGGAATLAVRFL